LVTKNQVIGAFEAINKRNGAAYTEQDTAVLQALASQAAVAIENARLFQQSDLVAEIMHELKTPLMALTAASELLARGPAEERRQELLQMLQRETTRLSKMTQDFLDLARLESGRMRIAREPLDLPALVHDVVCLQEPQAAARGVALEAKVPQKLPLVRGDFNRLKQVLLNLTSNAIKYNLEGGRVIIRVRAMAEHVAIAVQDTGPGIDPKNLSRLFERFYRIPDREGFSEGSGLGLAIAQKIVEEHAGRIEVESEVGKGSTFCCYLPISE
ncbi:MAG: HAMP domain-containing histidine kinase, partial [Chloroflexi bacterium]|nr:HAMP domain-containing histidine kinase [Chloroflexota bacterium]MCI0731022.1 HAMP domain-containing histidine kinase [Chloroflexota bacterium]